MSNPDVESAVRTAAQKLQKLLTDAATLTITTSYNVVGADGAAPAGQPVFAAKTVISIDGDWQASTPVRQGDAGRLEREEFLFTFHQENVKAATAYRTAIVGTLIDALRTVV